MEQQNINSENGAAGFPLETIVMPSDSDPVDFWGDDDFEDSVAAALISCYESKIQKNKSVAPADRLRDKHLNMYRGIGPYIPSSSREICFQEGDKGYFDIDNDPLPTRGCLSLRINRSNANMIDEYHGYISNFYIGRAKALGNHWCRSAGGQLYVMYMMVMQDNGRVNGERRFFTVNKDGVQACYLSFGSAREFGKVIERNQLLVEPEIVRETTQNASFALQYISDRRFSWVITAKEGFAKAHLGCMQEEVKSLLYARDLPLTATGRKKPILHLVAAHKRRMKNGTDVDVSQFLRGAQTVHIGNTEFIVKPPLATREKMPASQRFFEA